MRKAFLRNCIQGGEVFTFCL